MAKGLPRVALTDSVTGIYTVTIGLFLFAIQDVIIKSFSDTYSLIQIVFVRSFTAIIIMVTVILYTAGRHIFRVHKPWPIILKGSCGFFSYIAYYMAISSLPLADAATITFSAPIMVTAISAVLFKEQVGWRRWSAVLIGFVAIVLVVGPKGHFNNIAVVLALAAAFTYAISTIATRFIDTRDNALTAAFYALLTFLFWSVACSLIVVLFLENNYSDVKAISFLLRSWSAPTQIDQWLMVLLGFISAGGFYCLVKAYMVAEFSVVAPFEYLYIVWGALFGFLFWREIPSIYTVLGVSLLLASNYYILQREVALKKRNAYRRPRIPHR